MSIATRNRRSRSTITTAATLGAMLASGSILLSAPAAFAADVPAAVLSVQVPGVVGFAGESQVFTETVTNPGTTEADFDLQLNASNTQAGQHNAIAMDYQDTDGSWKSLPLTFAQGNNTFNFAGKLPTTLKIPAGGKKTVQLRIGVPMGTAHKGNNGTGSFNAPLKLHSTLVTADKSATVVAEDDKNITVKSLTTELKGLPRTAVAGGAPIDFDVVVTNPSPSNYTNLSNLIYAEPQTTLQVQQADGSWTKLTGVPSTQPGGRVHYYLDGHDSTLAAGATITKHVRLTYTADTPLGDSYVIPRILVNEGTDAYGTPMGPQGTAIKIVSASTVVVPASDTTTTTTATTATAVGATVRTSGTTGTTTALASTGQLAQTGSGGITAAAATAFALLASGLGALWQVRRRRSA